MESIKTSKFNRAFTFFLKFLGFEDTLDCIFPKEPELENLQFPMRATVDYYSIKLRAEINALRDGDYNCYFDVEGLMLGCESSVNLRNLIIEVRPSLKVTFDVTVFVSVAGLFWPIANEEP